MSNFDQAFGTKPAKAKRELRQCEAPAFKPIGIPSVRAVLEQMREKSAPKSPSLGTADPRLDDPWAA